MGAHPVFAQSTTEVKVMISGGFSAAYEKLVPEFEARERVKVITIHGPSMGATPAAIPNRLARGEAADVVILAESGLDKLIKEGTVVPASRTDLAQSVIALAVKEGAPVRPLKTKDDLTKILLNAKSIAVSGSASGVYISNRLYQTLGMQEQVKDKTRVAVGEPVAALVARGDAEIGFQQLSELKPVPGITIVGPIPPEVQKITVFSAGVVKNAPNEKAGQALIRFLASDEAKPILQDAGMEPAPGMH